MKRKIIATISMAILFIFTLNGCSNSDAMNKQIAEVQKEIDKQANEMQDEIDKQASKMLDELNTKEEQTLDENAINETEGTTDVSPEQDDIELSTSENIEEKSSFINNPEKFVNDVKTSIEDDVGENESIVDIKFENKDLCVYVDISNADTSILSIEDLAKSRTGSITDSILELNEYDDLWETITVDFGNVGKIKNSKDNMEANDYGRYFLSENFILE